MHKTPPRIFREIEATRPPCERYAIFKDHSCGGRSTMEHAWKYAGRQINEVWAIIRLCARAHSVDQYQTKGGILDKRINEFISLTHATDEDLKKYPRTDWDQERKKAEHYVRKINKQEG